MNGGAMDFRQDQALHSQNKSSSLQSPGYLLQKNSYQQQNSHPQYSKAMNHPDSYVDLELWKNRDAYSSDFRTRNPLTDSIADILEARRRPRTPNREPMELPVPQFEIDENYVGVIPNSKTSSLIQNSKDLDLDTRINLLIKSKALSGMHPIFSELSESEEFSQSSDDSLTDFTLNSKHEIPEKVPPPQGKIPCHDSFDNPETPLSRPPSPFLSRASYLFWFNKAIELKQQAKAQEKALIEQATKKMLKNTSVLKPANRSNSKQDSNLFLKSLLDEVGKELKETIKEHFMNQIIESFAFSSLENWWENQKLPNDNLLENLVVCSTTDKSGDILNKVEDEKPVVIDITENNVQRSSSPKDPFPWTTTNQEAEETTNTAKSQSDKEDNILQKLIARHSFSGDSDFSDASKNVSSKQDKVLGGFRGLVENDLKMITSSQKISDIEEHSDSRPQQVSELPNNEHDQKFQCLKREEVNKNSGFTIETPPLFAVVSAQQNQFSCESYQNSLSLHEEPNESETLVPDNNCPGSNYISSEINCNTGKTEEELSSLTAFSVVNKQNLKEDLQCSDAHEAELPELKDKNNTKRC